MYLLDTNTLIYFFKGIGKVAENLLSTPPEEIAIPTIALYELQIGIAKSTRPEKRESQLDTLVSRVNISPFNTKEAAAAARIRAVLESAGTPMGPYDAFIAGIAISNSYTLVTHNTQEFKRVKHLILEDWY